MEKEIKYIDLDKDVLKYYEQIDTVDRCMERIKYDLICIKNIVEDMADTDLREKYEESIKYLRAALHNAMNAMNNVNKPDPYYMYKLKV